MNQYFEDISKEQFKAFLALPIDQPLQMLNLLRFKDKVTDTGISGKEQYQIYLRATTPFFEKANAKVIFIGKPEFTLIGPTENEWDKVLIVRYETKKDFMDMVLSDGYPSDLRRKAILDSRLIFCTSSM